MRTGTMLAAMLVMLTAGATAHAKMEMRTFPVLAGAGAHDVYPAPDGAMWFTAQSAGKLGRLDPRTEKFESFPLPDSYASVRQLAGRKGEVWGAESAADKLFMIKSE